MCFPLRVIGKAKYVADHFAAPCITVSVTAAAPTAELCYYKKYVSHVAFYAPPLYCFFHVHLLQELFEHFLRTLKTFQNIVETKSSWLVTITFMRKSTENNVN